MKRALNLTAALLSMAASAAAGEGREASSLPPCVDTVAVGNVISQNTRYAPVDENAWLDAVPWKVHWNVHKVIAGSPLPPRLTTIFDSHAGFGKGSRPVLLLLQRIGDRWWLVYASGDVVVTRDSRYAMPFFEDLSEGQAEALFWLPRDWRDRLVPIEYNSRRYAHVGPAITPGEPENEWRRIDGAQFVARRGLMLVDIGAQRPESADGACARGPPEHWPEELKNG